ncbi:hypothetical protein K4F52_010268 [Lecanicillium sp. MT-2017a]|nr:hypothetical protein K4F52_010268 [Lecanicillium sp. MT-2017a]
MTTPSESLRKKDNAADVVASPCQFYPSPPASPRPSSVADATLTAPADSLDIRTLAPPEPKVAYVDAGEATNNPGLNQWKTALGLHRQQCGGTTRELRRCKNPVPARSTSLAESAIESLRARKGFLADFEAQLSRLARISLCHVHYGQPEQVESRVDSWMLSSDEALNVKQPIVSLKRRVCKVFGLLPTTCTGFEAAEVACTKGLGGQKLQNCTKTFWKIAELCHLSAEEELLEYYIRVLGSSILCQSHDRATTARRREWEERLTRLRNTCREEWESATGVKKTALRPLDASDYDQHTDLEDEAAGPTISSRSRAAPSREVRDVAEFWPKESIDSPWEVIRMESGAKPDNYLHRHISKLARTVLNTSQEKSENEVNDGFVYIYQVPGNDDLVKIGFTTKEVKLRHAEWAFDCNREVKLIDHVGVPHARRVEALVHKELSHRNVRIYCNGCLRIHKEWFRISSEDAKNAVKKWSRWADRRPYERVVSSAGMEWKLKSIENGRFGDAEYMKSL